MGTVKTWRDLDHYLVEYMDGDTVEARPTARARIEVERKWPEGAIVDDDGKLVVNPARPMEESSFYAAWWSLGRPDDVFETWLDRVRDLREVFREADPSQPAAGDA